MNFLNTKRAAWYFSHPVFLCAKLGIKEVALSWVGWPYRVGTIVSVSLTLSPGWLLVPSPWYPFYSSTPDLCSSTSWQSPSFDLSHPGYLLNLEILELTFSFSCYRCSVTQSCPTLCSPMDCSTRGFPVLQHLLELAQTHVHRVSDAIQPSHPLSFPSSPAFNLSQHWSLF